MTHECGSPNGIAVHLPQEVMDELYDGTASIGGQEVAILTNSEEILKGAEAARGRDE